MIWTKYVWVLPCENVQEPQGEQRGESGLAHFPFQLCADVFVKGIQWHKPPLFLTLPLVSETIGPEQPSWQVTCSSLCPNTACSWLVALTLKKGKAYSDARIRLESVSWDYALLMSQRQRLYFREGSKHIPVCTGGCEKMYCQCGLKGRLSSVEQPSVTYLRPLAKVL